MSCTGRSAGTADRTSEKGKYEREDLEGWLKPEELKTLLGAAVGWRLEYKLCIGFIGGNKQVSGSRTWRAGSGRKSWRHWGVQLQGGG